jgi:hypothetical protein
VAAPVLAERLASAGELLLGGGDDGESATGAYGSLEDECRVWALAAPPEVE